MREYCISVFVTHIGVAIWRAHTQKITQLVFLDIDMAKHDNVTTVQYNRLLLVEQWNVIISASTDTSVRAWTLDGNFIGIYTTTYTAIYTSCITLYRYIWPRGNMESWSSYFLSTSNEI